MRLRTFQRRFLRSALAPGIRTACLSLPRGNGKSALAGYIVARALTPDDPLFVSGGESVLISGSIEQCRVVYRFARRILEPTGAYRFLDSATRCAITHKATNTRLRVVGSNARTTMGLVNCPLAIWDEPGAAETIGGGLMWDAVRTAQGKPDSPLRAIMIGTVAPTARGWWPELIERGSRGSTHVTALQGDLDTWDQWTTIRRANPLMTAYAESRRTLLEERDAARADSRLKAAFCSYRLNVPTQDESTTLITVPQWQAVLRRPVPERTARPVCGLDMGEGRAWCAAVAIWRSGRTEAIAVAPGLPDVDQQERRDRVPRGTYSRLLNDGTLSTADGLHMPTARQVVDRIMPWRPTVIVCDYFRLPDVVDAVKGRARVVSRRPLWSNAAEDVRAARKMALDGPLAVEAKSHGLLTASLAVTVVENDKSGNTRIVKGDPGNNTGRDDASVALTLAAGAWARIPAPRKVRIHVA